jgi:16S rRNA (uracil1498-N3)-methyltransferase
VNLLLVDEHEVSDGQVTLRDRRADHLRTILAVTVGQRVRCGLVGGRIGHAAVIAMTSDAIVLTLDLTVPSPPPMPVALVLAVPRPKVLARVLEIAAAFAIERIELVNAWRVDKAYFGSPRLTASALSASVRLGAEQGVTTHVPPVRVHARFMAFLDQHHPAGATPGRWLCAHARGAEAIERAPTGRELPTVLAIGPEGGWIDRELDTFTARGFTLVSLGDAVLRVEAAVAGGLAQLALLARIR